MKRFVSFLVMFGLIFSMTGFCFAANPVIESQTVTTETLDDGTTVKTTFTVYASVSRAQEKSANVQKTYSTAEGIKMATVTLYATFHFNGDDAWVVSSYSDYTTYNGWSYGSESIRESGNKVTLSGWLTKSGAISQVVSMYITCSSSGAISRG